MPKNSRKKEAALRRERDKRGETDPAEAAELAADATYTPPAPSGEFDSDLTPSRLGEKIKNLARAAAATLLPPTAARRTPQNDLNPATEARATSRMHQRENADLVDRPAPGQSTSTKYRNAHGKTKKAKAAKTQHRLTSFFSQSTSKSKSTDVVLPNDSDSDIELVTSTEIEPSGISVEVPMETPDEPEHCEAPAPVLHSEPVEPSIAAAAAERDETPNSIPESEPVEPPAADTATPLRTPGPPSFAPVAANTPQLAHAELEKCIAKRLRLLRKSKTMLTDTSAANQVFDLEAVRLFNNQRLKNFEKLQTAQRRVKNAPPRCKAKMRRLVPKIKPNLDASETVATALSKGPAFARRLRKMAKNLEIRGELPESMQGKGAFHATLLDNPDVLSAVRVWATGALKFDEGGFEGKIKPAKLTRRHFVTTGLGVMGFQIWK
ncbi:hypothetical protein DFH06DRAFT_1328283 [Mycena polygramma]|nr:hypothetical protein DFH06DRAFT_1328283 [Mycena polygramma]